MPFAQSEQKKSHFEALKCDAQCFVLGFYSTFMVYTGNIIAFLARALSLSFTLSLRDDTILNARAHQVCACTVCDIDIRFPFDVFSAIISTYANLCREPRKQNKIRINVLFLLLYSSQPKELLPTKSRPEIDAHPRNLEIEMGHHNHKTNRNDRIVLYKSAL